MLKLRLKIAGQSYATDLKKSLKMAGLVNATAKNLPKTGSVWSIGNLHVTLRDGLVMF